MQIYVVQRGDNVDQIAAGFNIRTERLIYDNQIDPPYRLAVGQALLIRSDAEAVGGITETVGGIGASGMRPPLETNGYAYPYINEDILNETLPFLTDLSIFSYGFTKDGELIPPKINPEWMIAAAQEKRTRPMLVLTPLGLDGRFNSNLVTVLVGDKKLQQRLIRELWIEMEEKNFGGVDLDFEYVQAEDRVGYAEFVSRATQILNVFGYKVTVALAPKTSGNQRGILYEGIDYRLLGEAANQVMLMTYEWGYTSEPLSLW